MAQDREFASHSCCFACGRLNREGLGLSFEHTGLTVLCRTRVDSRFQSYDGVVHGGILAAIADSVMVNLVHHEYGGRPLTGSLTLRYKGQIHVGDEIAAEARIVRTKHKTIWASCRIAAGDRLCVLAEAAFRIEPAS